MVFNSKQLEELDNATGTGSNIFENPGDSSNQPNDATETALAWRRTVLEDAHANVKRSGARPVDPTMTYEIGSLLFDRENRTYGRVKRSIPGFLDVSYLTGGDREYGKLNVKAYLKEYGESKPVTEIARSLDMQEMEIMSKLAGLGLKAQIAEPASNEAGPVNGTEEQFPGFSDDLLGEVAEIKAVPEPKKTKAKAKTKAKTKNVVIVEDANAADRRKKRAMQIADAPIPVKPANPIDDPNTFIRQNFNDMSNRELARSTGLSEHTVRRKLGEWKLKRTKKLPRKKG